MPMQPKNWYRLKEHLEANGRSGIARDLAEALGWSSATLIGAYRPGLDSGELVKTYERRSVTYSLAEEGGPQEVRWVWWDDGDLIVYGLEENTDGSHTLPAQLVEAIRKRITGADSPNGAAANDNSRKAA